MNFPSAPETFGLLLIFVLVIFIMYRQGFLPDFSGSSESTLSEKLDNLYYEVALPVLEKSKRITDRARQVNLRASKLKGAKGNDNK